jgi:hypothetical protein
MQKLICNVGHGAAAKSQGTNQGLGAPARQARRSPPGHAPLSSPRPRNAPNSHAQAEAQAAKSPALSSPHWAPAGQRLLKHTSRCQMV